MNIHSLELQTALQAAKRGAEYAMRFFGKEFKAVKKKDNTVFTHVDKATEEIIKKIIESKFPNARFVGEETGGIPDKGTFWTIDPIDGTRHFARNIPLWSVLVALIENGKPVIGVSNTPCLNEIVYAEQGKGAFLNEEKISVSRISKLKDSLVIFGSLRFFKEIFPLFKVINACGSARSFVSPYELHLLASGRCEIVLDVYAKIWDIAPFKIIIEEAGGRVTNWKGKSWMVDDRGFVATNGILHDEIIRIVSNI